jgi:hypothetical protein
VTKHGRIEWPGIFAEGTAIVVSILLAFAIDAWWDDRKQADEQRAQLQSLLGEFEQARGLLARQIGSLQRALDGTARVLDLMGPDAGAQQVSLAGDAMRQSLNIGVLLPQQGTLTHVLGTRSSGAVGSDRLWSLLQAWPTMMSDLQQDGQHLERNREENYFEGMIALGVPMLAFAGSADESPEVSADTPLDSDDRLRLPESKFDADLSLVLRDPGIETIFAVRMLRLQILIDGHEEAIAAADQVIRLLREAT